MTARDSDSSQLSSSCRLAIRSTAAQCWSTSGVIYQVQSLLPEIEDWFETVSELVNRAVPTSQYVCRSSTASSAFASFVAPPRQLVTTKHLINYQ